MMQMNNVNTPLYRIQWGMPRYKAPSKVVSIPVHFVGSDSEHRRTESVIKIQKVARGFLVRNTMRRIKAIRVEVEQIEHRVSAPETVELIRRDPRERVRVSETIMNLLLRLDSVRVLNYYSGVRDCRKSVIKRAIALQEMVDQMVGPTDQDQQAQITQAEDAAADKEDDSGSVGASSEMAVVGDSDGKKMEDLGNEEEKMEVEKKEKDKEDSDGEGEDATDQDQPQSQAVSNQEEPHHEPHAEDEDADADYAGSVGASAEMFVGDSEGKKMEALGNEEEMEVEEKEKEDGEGECVGEESVGTSLVEENCLVKEEEQGGVGCCEEEECKGGRGGEDGDRNRELLERMMEDNERMMGMMAQLFQRNEMQTRLLSSLSHRVEQLERAFACEKLRRKKRRNADAKHKEAESKNGCI